MNKFIINAGRVRISEIADSHDDLENVPSVDKEDTTARGYFDKSEKTILFFGGDITPEQFQAAASKTLIPHHWIGKDIEFSYAGNEYPITFKSLPGNHSTG